MSCTLTYTLSVTGDCSNTNVGAFNLEIYGSAPDYTIQWISPASLGTIALGPGVTAYTETSLSAATYTFNLIDSCEPNTVQAINVYISSGTCVSISGWESTVCGENNGSITATTSNLYGVASFYLYDSVFGYITSGTSLTNSFVFNTLSASTYYVVANDGGGCTGQSESVIILDSTTIDYGLYIVNDAGCAVNSGKIFVTGLTGNPPYTYLWSNSQTTSSITGLSIGSYSVTVTDSTGCSVSKTGYVDKVPPIGIVSVFTTGPDCFSSNGEVTVVVTGGTGPYYYSGSTSTNNGPSFDSEYTFTNLGSGPFDIKVTDAGLCNATATTFITTPGGFSVVSITTTNSTCNNSGGSIGINLFGGTPPYVYTLVKSGGSTLSQNTVSSTWSFTNLSSGTYTLTISDGGPCTYTNTYIIENTVLFTLTETTTGTTCNNSNGIVTVEVSGGTPPYTYILDGVQTESNSLSAVTFSNLSSGFHTVNVTDNSSCSQDITFLVDSSDNVDFVLTSTDATTGNNGTITSFITSGEPPFTYLWSSNTGGQTTPNVSNLSAGTYSLTITDDNGCTNTRTITINGNTILNSYQTFNVCNSDFTNNGQNIAKGLKQMLLEGFYDLTIDDTNCILNHAIFEASVSVSGVTKVDSFYTGTTLLEYPTEEQWNGVIEGLLTTYDGIGSVTFNIEDNTMTILSDCNSTISLNDAEVVIDLKIYYDISCVSCGGPCNCYSIVGPNGCSVQYLDCNLQEVEVILDGTQEIRVCGKSIINSGCVNSCLNPLEYFFNYVNTNYAIQNPLQEEPIEYGGFISNNLTNGIVVSNATNIVCCPECGVDDINFYLLSDGTIYSYSFVNLNQSPNCCYNYSANTVYHDEVIDVLINNGLTPTLPCSSEFLNILPQLETVIGETNYDDFISSFGIYENPMTQNTTLLQSLIDGLLYAKNNFGISENELYFSLKNLLELGFASFCKNDYVYMGSPETGFGKVYSYSTEPLPSAVCNGLTIDNISECVDGICPSACTSPVNYLFDELEPYEIEEYSTYIEYLQSTLNNTLVFDNSDGFYCCPDNCTGEQFYYISNFYRFQVNWVNYFEPKVVDITDCCLNHMLTGEAYEIYSTLVNLGIDFSPKVCCDSFEPCIQNFLLNVSGKDTLTLVEVSTINGFSPLCDIIQRISQLPYTDIEKIYIFFALLNSGMVIGCKDNNVFIGRMFGYVNWITPA